MTVTVRRSINGGLGGKVRRALVLPAVLAGACVALTTSTAHAAIGTPTGRLTVTKASAGKYNVRITGVVPGTQAEAQSLKDSRDKVVLTLFGDDPVVDDDLVKIDLISSGPSVQVAPTGLHFNFEFPRSSRTLNEDPFPERGDELFVRIELKSSSGARKRLGRTNTVSGRY
jgi:hypothetical protein